MLEYYEDVGGQLRSWVNDISFYRFQGDQLQKWITLKGIFDSVTSTTLYNKFVKEEHLLDILASHLSINTLEESYDIWQISAYCFSKCLSNIGVKIFQFMDLSVSDLIDDMLEIMECRVRNRNIDYNEVEIVLTAYELVLLIHNLLAPEQLQRYITYLYEGVSKYDNADTLLDFIRKVFTKLTRSCLGCIDRIQRNSHQLNSMSEIETLNNIYPNFIFLLDKVSYHLIENSNSSPETTQISRVTSNNTILTILKCFAAICNIPFIRYLSHIQPLEFEKSGNKSLYTRFVVQSQRTSRKISQQDIIIHALIEHLSQVIINCSQPDYSLPSLTILIPSLNLCPNASVSRSALALLNNILPIHSQAQTTGFTQAQCTAFGSSAIADMFPDLQALTCRLSLDLWEALAKGIRSLYSDAMVYYVQPSHEYEPSASIVSDMLLNSQLSYLQRLDDYTAWLLTVIINIDLNSQGRNLDFQRSISGGCEINREEDSSLDSLFLAILERSGLAVPISKLLHDTMQQCQRLRLTLRQLSDQLPDPHQHRSSHPRGDIPEGPFRALHPHLSTSEGSHSSRPTTTAALTQKAVIDLTVTSNLPFSGPEASNRTNRNTNQVTSAKASIAATYNTVTSTQPLSALTNLPSKSAALAAVPSKVYPQLPTHNTPQLPFQPSKQSYNGVTAAVNGPAQVQAMSIPIIKKKPTVESSEANIDKTPSSTTSSKASHWLLNSHNKQGLNKKYPSVDSGAVEQPSELHLIDPDFENPLKYHKPKQNPIAVTGESKIENNTGKVKFDVFSYDLDTEQSNNVLTKSDQRSSFSSSLKPSANMERKDNQPDKHQNFVQKNESKKGDGFVIGRSLRAQLSQRSSNFVPGIQDLRQSKGQSNYWKSSNFKTVDGNSGGARETADWHDADEREEEGKSYYLKGSNMSEYNRLDRYDDPGGLDDDEEYIALQSKPKQTRTKASNTSTTKSSGAIDLSALLSGPEKKSGDSSQTLPANQLSAANDEKQGKSRETNIVNKKQKKPVEDDESLENISIDNLLKSVLGLKLADLEHDSNGEHDDTSLKIEKTALTTVPNRFVHEDHYIEVFRPLLLEEVKAALGDHICRGGDRGPGRSDRRAQQTHQGLNIVYVRCAYFQPRQDEELQEARVAKVKPEQFNSLSREGSKSSSGGNKPATDSDSGELYKDDLVILVKAADVGGIKSLHDVVKIQHVLAIVTTTMKENSKFSTRPAYTSNITEIKRAQKLSGEASLEDSSFRTSQHQGDMQQTLLLINGSSPPYQETWACVMVMNLSTFFREWTALHCIKSHRLMPLAPYILKAAPVVSSFRLREIEGEVSSKLNIIETYRGQQDKTKDARLEMDAKSAFKSLVSILRELKDYPVDGSVLKKSGIGKAINSIGKDGRGSSKLKDLATELVDHWTKQVKTDNSKTTVTNLKGGRLVELPTDDIPQPPMISGKLWEALRVSFNKSQLFALYYIVTGANKKTQDTQIALIQGPPGTGKTSTILGMISVLLHQTIHSSSTPTTETSSTSPEGKGDSLPSSIAGSITETTTPETDKGKDQKPTTNSHARLLVCAPSNAAVDEILSRLMKGVLDSHGVRRNVKMIRLGKTIEGNGSDPEVDKLSLDYQTDEIVKRNISWQQLQSAKNSISEQLGKLRPLAGSSDEARTIRKSLDELRRHKLWAEICVDRLRVETKRTLLANAEVIGCTLSSSGQQHFIDHILENDVRFDCAIIDEAAQTTEPSTLIPIRYGCRRLILVGDPRQLPATVLSQPAEAAGLGVSLFERLERSGHEVVMLTVQHRMHPDIRQFPSTHFYQGKLRDADAITNEVKTVEETDVYPPESLVSIEKLALRRYLKPLQFFDLKSSREEKIQKSYKNENEVKFIINILQTLNNSLEGLSLAVITPYKSQVRTFRDSLRVANFSSSLKQRLEINTVDGFQGREKDIVFFSCVRSSKNIGFLADDRRMNVAITRARRCLVMIGCMNALKYDHNWAALLTSLEARNLIRRVDDDSKLSALPPTAAVIKAKGDKDKSSLPNGTTDLDSRRASSGGVSGDAAAVVTSTSNSRHQCDENARDMVVMDMELSNNQGDGGARGTIEGEGLEAGEIGETPTQSNNTHRKGSWPSAHKLINNNDVHDRKENDTKRKHFRDKDGESSQAVKRPRVNETAAAGIRPEEKSYNRRDSLESTAKKPLGNHQHSKDNIVSSSFHMPIKRKKASDQE